MLPIENSGVTGIRIVRDPEACERIWKGLYPADSLFDLWEVRAAFARSYDRQNCFILHGEGDTCHGIAANTPLPGNHCINGLLPLSWIPEKKCFGFFPGETWQGRTWLEQNKIIAPDQRVLKRLLRAVPGPAELRYLSPAHPPFSNASDPPAQEKRAGLDDIQKSWQADETGYLFYLKSHGDRQSAYSTYLDTFSGKSKKKRLAEIRALEKKGLSFRYNELTDLAHLFRLNMARFGDNGYFHDPRFLKGFKAMARTLHEKNMLRVVTLLVGDTIAAVDMGGVWRRICTFLAGGTSDAFPGISRIINLHHIQWACAHTGGLGEMMPEDIDTLDFLCGDFGWKEKFHLTARPLHKITLPEKGCHHESAS